MSRDADVTRRLLVVTNDFPPRQGGIQSFVHGVVSRPIRPGRRPVLLPLEAGSARIGRDQPYPVVRAADLVVLLPSPQARRERSSPLECRCTESGSARRPRSVCWRRRCAGPGPSGSWRRRTVTRPAGPSSPDPAGCWAGSPAVRRHDLSGRLDQATTGCGAGTPSGLDRLPAGVDAPPIRAKRFAVGPARVARAPGLVCVSRLMPRKGQDALSTPCPEFRRQFLGAALVLVGGGPATRPGSNELARAAGGVAAGT